jgi:hypothetical protein
MKPPAWLHTLAVSALCAFIVWALSPLITGHKEPWDAPNHYYSWAIAIAGLISGLFSPRVFWAYFAGSVAGQFLYVLIFLTTGPLIAIGVLFMCAFGLLFFAAALLANFLRGRALAMVRKR